MQLIPAYYKITIEEKHSKSITNTPLEFGYIIMEELFSEFILFKRSQLG